MFGGPTTAALLRDVEVEVDVEVGRDDFELPALQPARSTTARPAHETQRLCTDTLCRTDPYTRSRIDEQRVKKPRRRRRGPAAASPRDFGPAFRGREPLAERDGGFVRSDDDGKLTGTHTPNRARAALARYAALIAFSAYTGAVGLAGGAIDTSGTLDTAPSVPQPGLRSDRTRDHRGRTEHRARGVRMAR